MDHTDQWCIALGHAEGFQRDRSAPIRLGRVLGPNHMGFLSTDCALIGGDSGGPLFDLAGRLIAVHSRIGNDVQENLHVPIDHYDYAWDLGDLGMVNSEDINNLPAGTYSVTVTSNDGQTATATYTVEEPASAVSINSTFVVDPLCAGENGSISVIAAGGTHVGFIFQFPATSGCRIYFS